MFKLVYKNLVGQLKNQRMLFLLLVLNIVISCLVICFSYGLYQNYNMIVEEGEQKGTTDLNILVDSENFVAPDEKTDVKFVADITFGRVKEFALALDIDTRKNIDHISSRPVVSSPLTYECGSTAVANPDDLYSDDKAPFYFQTLALFGIEGDKFTEDGRYINFIPEEERGNGVKKIVLSENYFDPTYSFSEATPFDVNWTFRVIPKDTESVLINGESYNVYKAPHPDLVWIPVESVPDEARLMLGNYDFGLTTRNPLSISFKEPMTRKQYEDIKSCVDILGGGAYVENITITDAKEIYYYKTIMLISVVIAVLAAINMAILYRYILEKRSSQLAIFRICGCSKMTAINTYLAECLVINVPLFALTELLYHKLIMPRLASLFPNMAGAYSFALYAVIFAIYIGASTIIMRYMIIATVRKHSLVALKSANRSTSRFGIMKVFEVIQLAAVLTMMVLIVSAILSRYDLYLPFEKYFEREGFMVIATDPMTYDKDLEEYAGSDDMINCQITSRVIGDVDFGGIAYDDEFIESYAPPLEEGVWLSDSDDTYEKNGYIPAVITSCGGRYKVGDVLSQDYDIYNSVSNSTETVTAKFKIIGVLKDKVNIASYVLDKPMEYGDCRDIFNVFSDSFEENDWLLTRLSDEYAFFKSSSVVWGTQFVFYDGESDEQLEQHKNKLLEKFKVMPLEDVKKGSMQYIYEQMYTLFPIAVCIFILTIISTVSISAIYTKRQLRNYAIFYICGARWRTCALRSLKNSAITCGIASILAAVVLIIGKLTLLKETVISFGIWHFAVCALVIILYLALSMIMPLAIIGSNQPKEVLKED